MCVSCVHTFFLHFFFFFLPHVHIDVDLQSGDLIPALAVVELWFTTTCWLPRRRVIGDFFPKQ